MEGEPYPISFEEDLVIIFSQERPRDPTPVAVPIQVSPQPTIRGHERESTYHGVRSVWQDNVEGQMLGPMYPHHPIETVGERVRTYPPPCGPELAF